MGKEGELELPTLNRREKIVAAGAFAGLCALALIGGSIAGRILFEDEEVPRLPVPEEPSPVETLPPETIPESADQPEEGSSKEVPLKNGFLARGGLLLRASQAIGVDCIESYSPQTGESAKSREAWLPVNLDRGFSPSRAFAPNTKSIIYIGEETEEPALGFVALSDGLALEYDPLADLYTAYTFKVEQTQDRGFVEELPEILNRELPRGTAIGRKVRVISNEEMREGISLTDENKELTAEIELRLGPPPSKPPGSEGPLRLVVQCNKDGQAA